MQQCDGCGNVVYKCTLSSIGDSDYCDNCYGLELEAYEEAYGDDEVNDE